MSLLLLVMVFLLVYCLTKLFLGSYTITDDFTVLYDYAISRDYGEILNSVRGIKKVKVDYASNEKKSMKYKNDYIKLSIDDKYRDREVSKYINKVKLMLYIRKFRNIFAIAFKEIINALPLILLVLLGSSNISLIVSGVMMVLYSLYYEYNFREYMKFIYEEEVADEITSTMMVRVGVVVTSLQQQLHVLIFLITIKLMTNI